MDTPMIPRALHTPAWMEEELRLLSFHTKVGKNELMRRMIAAGLASCWAHLREGKPTPHPILDGKDVAQGAPGTPDIQALFLRLSAQQAQDAGDAA